MMVNTAVCFLLLAAGLLAWSWERERWACWPWLAVALISVVALIEHLGGVSLGVDEAFWRQNSMGAVDEVPGRMSVNAAICLCCMAVAFLALVLGGRRRWLVLIPAGVTLCFGLLALLGYASGLKAAHSWGGFAGMSLPAAVLFLLAGATAVEAVAQFHRGLGFNSPPALFTVALVLLVACGRMTQVMNAEVGLANREVVRAFEFREATHRYMLALTRMQSSDRAYALTGDEHYAGRQAVYVSELRAALSALEWHVEGSPFRRARVDQLRLLTDRRVEESVAMVHARKAGDISEQLRLMRPAARLVTELVAEMEAEEDLLLKGREISMRRIERNAGLVLATGVLVGALLLAAAFYLVHRARRALQLSHMALERRVNERTAELQRSEENLRFLADTMPQMVWTARTDGAMETFNEGWHDYTGLERGDSPQNWAEAVHAEDARSFTDEWTAAVRGGREARGEYRLRRAGDGAFRWHLWRARPQRDRLGRLVRWVGTSTDIHDQKEAAQALERAVETRTAALRDSEERFRQSFQFAGIGMALVGLDGRWLQVNPAVCQILGYTAEELFAKTFQDITHPEDLTNDLALLRQLVAGERSFYQMEKRYIHRDGRVVWGRLTVTLVRQASGEPVHFVSQIEDIGVRRELEANLARARDEAVAAARLKAEFLANMSHEIRTPMNGVLGMARLLMGTKLGQEQRRMSQVVLSSAENLLTIIDDILDFSKIEAGKMRIDPHGFDLVKLVRETADLLAAQAQAKGVVLLCETGPEETCKLAGDSGRIRQVLTNLLGNALKFTAQGRVEISLRIGAESGGQRRFSLTVSDTGIGMTPEVQTRLFQPFMQGEAGGRKYGGTGLGLAICRQLVELMGGRIGCESREGEGSRFWFQLELPVWNPEEEQVGRPAKLSRGAGGLRLLVAEDNPANQLVARLTLERMGHDTVVVNNGREALEKLAVERFDAVLMDCQMPEVDGYEATRRLRAGMVPDADKETPVIALTAYALAGDRARCLAAGMNEYVTKPINADQLRQALARCGIDPGKTRTAPPMGTTPPVPVETQPVLVEEQLARLAVLKSPDGKPLTEHLFKMLAGEMPGRLAALETALEARDAEMLGRVAHTLAGSCANLGAAALEAVARELESEAKRGGWGGAAGCLTRIGNEWERLRIELVQRFPQSFS